MQSEKETGVDAGAAGRAHAPKAGVLVRGSAGSAVRNPPVGGNWQKCGEEGRRLVRPGYRGAYSTVTMTNVSLQEVRRVFMHELLLV